MASEYSFLSVFSNVPFDQNNNGDAILTGVSIPATIPAGNPSVPGFVDVVAFAVQPIQAAWVIVTNVIQQTDVGDLVSSLTFNNTTAVLMNHDSPNTPGNFYYVYDDSGTVDPATLPPATRCSIPTGRAVCRILSARMFHPACGCSTWPTASSRSPAT